MFEDKTQKRESKIQEMIDTAFEVWGDTAFKKTSLSMIAKRLNITKPALYRYFKDKKALLSAMQEDLVNKIVPIAESFIEEGKRQNFSELVLSFIDKHFTFFSKNLNHFFFYLVYVVKNNYFSHPQIIKIINKENDLFASVIRNTKTWLKPQDANFCVRMIFSTGIFILVYNYHNKYDEYDQNFPFFSDQMTENIVKNIYQICLKGFTQTDIKEIDYKKIEELSQVSDKDMPQRDKVYLAIAKVVAENGLWEASIAKIAKELNMSKSSLYFYFISKSDMLLKMVTHEFEKKIILIDEKLQQFETFEEKIYSFMVVLISYLLKDKSVIYVNDWLHFQGMQMKNMKKIRKEIFALPDFLKDLFEDNHLKKTDFNPDFLYAFLNMQIVKEIFLADLQNKEVHVWDMRYIYHFFLKGLLKK